MMRHPKHTPKLWVYPWVYPSTSTAYRVHPACTLRAHCVHTARSLVTSTPPARLPACPPPRALELRPYSSCANSKYSGCANNNYSGCVLLSSTPAVLIVSTPAVPITSAASQASAFVIGGAWVVKFLTGKVGRHKRFAKVMGSSGTLTWGKHVGVMARADPSPYPEDLDDGAARLQREQRVTGEEGARCFRIVLRSCKGRDAGTLIVMASSSEEKRLWLAGISAILSGSCF